MTLDELFSKMVEKSRKSSIEGAPKGSILLNLTGGDPRRWLVKLGEGKAEVSEAADFDTADLTVTASGETIVKVALRQTSPVAAFMTGKIKLSGDQGLVAQLKSIWPD
ncbi:MAG: SCP2 sterol-binding domain-containing protein [Deltaproteobacteria bacterium]|jgi:putative sterol carrier protein|nr:SCP2 sterol-binding domain-containing protein [Deltaproteobacteria bacterium]